MNSFSIKTLQSGGVITNYYCSSKCRHCLYACSPKRSKQYMDREQAYEIFQQTKAMGCYSVHIGGGEPFLNPEGLEMVLDLARSEGITVEYVETNSSWFTDIESAVDLLIRLKKVGLTTLLISISPFHNEFIPFRKVKGVMSACHRTGLSVFPWVYEFYNDIGKMDEEKTHTLEEYCKKFGNNYIKNIPNRYWVHLGGRALQTYNAELKTTTVEDIVSSNGGCSELADTSHFHFDLHGNYIPGLCTGLSINQKDLRGEITKDKYPLITTLRNVGIKGLLDIATKDYEFVPEERYVSKCHLCYEIRKHLVTVKGVDSHELQPVDFYSAE